MEIKLKLKVKDVEIELSQEDAKELRDALNSLVGKPEVIREYPWYPWIFGYPKTTFIGTPEWTHVYTTSTTSTNDVSLLASAG
jgi:hypothetical protein